uniref:Si:dkey-33c9.6 n=1 Tax=Scleropages formosus TaxID=113540 RepID=A0A8C9W031_SCLFO
MDVYKEAMDYLQTCNIAGVNETETDLVEDVFGAEAEDSFTTTALQADGADLPETPTDLSPDVLLDRRLQVLQNILKHEQQYLSELETLLTPMKALKASASTSQPVLSSQQVETLFYQVPELRDLHRDFYSRLRDRLGLRSDLQPDQDKPQGQGATHPPVGDLFLKMVSQLGVYRGFIDNYESAVDIVRTCTQAEPRFRTLAESMMSSKGPDNSRTEYTLEALLYKPLDRVTKTTLVLHDLLKHTPLNHPDHSLLQEALRISSSFLSGVNEDSHCKRAVTLSKGMRRQLMRDGFVVDMCEGEHSLRHLFLYTDLLLCTKLKGGAAGKPAQYRFSWYLPLPGLRLFWGPVKERPVDLQQRVLAMRGKMFQIREELQQRGAKGLGPRTLDRSYKKLQQCELWLFTHAPLFSLELHSPSGKSHTIMLPSLFELEEWRDAIESLRGKNQETVPPDLLALTSSCVKLRMTQQPRLQSLLQDFRDEDLRGTLGVVVHSACGLQYPASLSVHLEADGYQFFDNAAQTRPSLSSLEPQWDEEFSLLVDGAHCLRLLSVKHPESRESSKGVQVLARSCIQLDPALLKRWRKTTVSLGPVEVSISLRYSAHPLVPPSSTPTQQPPVFGVHIATLAQQEGVLVPHVVRSCAEEVERRGLEEVGIYRISGATSDIQALKSIFNISERTVCVCVCVCDCVCDCVCLIPPDVRDAMSRLRSLDVNTVSGALKLYFRELPESLIPAEHFQNLAAALDITDVSIKKEAILSILHSCPDVNRNTFLFLLHHLQRVAERQHLNKMSLLNLATVFGPSLVRPPAMMLGQSAPQVDISQEVVVQVQVVFFYLQCQDLPRPLALAPLEREDEEPADTIL